MATKLSVFLAVAVLISMPILAANTGTFRGPRVVVDAPDADPGLLPAPLSIDPIEPKAWAGKDFVISYDEPEPNLNDAKNPSVTVTPTNEYTREKGIAGSIHVVWEEMDETGATEIHYSMTGPEREGYPLNWSNDEEREGDRTVSETQKGKASPGDAVSPSMAIDQLGVIHAVWAQMQEDDTDTWEIHYARSDNNGKNWSSDSDQDPGRDIVISFIDPKLPNADSVSPPQICVGVDRTPDTKDALYVVWTEYNIKNGSQEVHFSRSLDAGHEWSGVQGTQIISDPESPNAYMPTIGAGGDLGQLVHVSWVQNLNQKAEGEEIYYTVSPDGGQEWVSERFISTPGEYMVIKGISMTTGLHDVHVAWSQYPQAGGIIEMYYAGSQNDGKNWPPEYNEVMISFSKDENPVGPPSIAVVDDVTKALPEVHVTWSELDEKSPAQTTEIHTSMTTDPWDPTFWTGLEKDIVISWPDDDETANARNPSVSLGIVNDEWSPQIVWEELNVYRKKDKVASNTEIHYPPPPIQYTLDVSVSPGGAGSVNKNPNQATYDDGSFVELTANANAGYVFDSWSGDYIGTDNPTTIVMDGNKTIVANFVVAYIDLVANSVSGPASCTEHATISITRSFSNTGNIDSGSFRYGLYLSTNNFISTGDTLLYSFQISNQEAGSTNTGTVNSVTLPWGKHGTFYYGLIADDLDQVTESVESNNWKASSAVTITQAELTLAVSTSGNGSVTKSPNQATYHYDDLVTLTAVPDPGWAFVEWTGDITSSANPYIVTINGNMVVTANFIPEYTQTLTAGWNRVSFPLVQSDTSIGAVLSSISWTDAVYFDASDGADHWKSYLDEDLTVLTHDMGFWVKVSSGCTLTVQGDRPGTTVINLYEGWNMIGYPAQNDGSYTVADLISDTTVTCVYQEDWWFFMTALDGSHVLENGEMYWVLVSADTTWTITW